MYKGITNSWADITETHCPVRFLLSVCNNVAFHTWLTLGFDLETPFELGIDMAKSVISTSFMTKISSWWNKKYLYNILLSFISWRLENVTLHRQPLCLCRKWLQYSFYYTPLSLSLSMCHILWRWRSWNVNLYCSESISLQLDVIHTDPGANSEKDIFSRMSSLAFLIRDHQDDKTQDWWQNMTLDCNLLTIVFWSMAVGLSESCLVSKGMEARLNGKKCGNKVENSIDK